MLVHVSTYQGSILGSGFHMRAYNRLSQIPWTGAARVRAREGAGGPLAKWGAELDHR